MGFQNVAFGRINGVTALTGFSYEKMFGHFAGTQKSGCNNEVTVRLGSTVERKFEWEFQNTFERPTSPGC